MQTPDDEYNGLTCEGCGGWRDVRVETEGYGKIKPALTCEDCFTPTDTGPCFYDLVTASAHFSSVVVGGGAGFEPAHGFRESEGIAAPSG